jgi:hypothetical protein
MNYSQEIRDLIEKFLDPDNGYNSVLLHQKLLDFEEKENPQKAQMIEYIINDFFSKNVYFYIHNKDIYIEYIDHHFSIISENDMLHHILQELNPYGLNTSLKQFIKCRIQKKIKESSIYNNIPNSNTIQNVLSHLSPNIFIKKNYAKYFLITLGDIIQHKTDHFYFLSINMKSFLQTINKYVSQYFHSINLFNHYKFKYYDHDVEKSRILKTTQLNMEYFKPNNHFYMDLICCALHYSRRYESGERFIEDITNQDIKSDIMWIKNTNKYNIIDKFIGDFTYTKDGINIHEKNMMFLWNLYLKQNNIINLFQKNIDVQNYISSKISYQSPYFLNCNSMFLPYVEQFNEFWNKYMYVDETEYPFELNDILKIFMETCKFKNKIDVQTLIDLIQYYHPSIEIIDSKSLKSVGCVLWNKKKEIDTFLIHQNVTDVNELYRIYSETFKNGRNISKQYFTEYYKELQTDIN